MAAKPSTFLDRRLVTDKPFLLRSLPAGWPLRSGPRLRVTNPTLLDPSKRYRVALDLDAGTATISEDIEERYAFESPSFPAPWWSSLEEALEHTDMVDAGMRLIRFYVDADGNIVKREDVEL